MFELEIIIAEVGLGVRIFRLLRFLNIVNSA